MALITAASPTELCPVFQTIRNSRALGHWPDATMAQGPDVPTTVPIPNPGQEQVDPAGDEVRIRQLPERVWQVAPMAGATGS